MPSWVSGIWDAAAMTSWLVSRGRGDLDHSALLTYPEDFANYRVGQEQS